MDFPFGHHNNNRHHHNRRDDEEPENYPPPHFAQQPPYGGAYPSLPPQTYPPPPSYGGAYPHAPPETHPGVHHLSHNPSMDYPPPLQPPHVTGVQHISHNTPTMDFPNYPPQQPQPPYEQHEYGGSHGGNGGGGSHHFRPHMPGFMGGGGHESNDLGVYNSNMNNNLEGYFGNKKSCKINCKAGGNSFCVGIRDGKVVLVYADPNDPTQHWYKDEKYSTKVKDEDGYPSFALVNKATGKAMKHPISGEPVELVPYKPDHLDGSILWTESKDLGSGFRTIRNVNNVHMVLDAFNGDKDHGGVHDGTFLSIFKCWKGDNQNQQWKIFTHCKYLKLFHSNYYGCAWAWLLGL